MKQQDNHIANRAIKYCLYPTDEQKVFFAKTFGCCRKIWNLMLSDRLANHQVTGKFESEGPAYYKSTYEYLKEVDSLALANVWTHLNQAFQNYFRKKKKKMKNPGFPKFKSKRKAKKSYTTNNQNGTIALLDDAIKLPKIGCVPAVIHRRPKPDWQLKSATVSQDSAGNYYVSVLFAYEQDVPMVSNPAKAIGLDYASNGLYVDNEGNVGSNHRYFRESERKLARQQKNLSRKQGSKQGEEKSSNYLKQLKKVNKIHRHIANQRKDHLHKKSTEIANQYDVVCVETLNLSAIANKKCKRGKSTLDNGFGMFLNMLEYKLLERGKFFVKIDKWYPSSQLCHNCGKRHPEMKDLKNRRMVCSCGYSEDRDVNAAKNILTEGLRVLREFA